MPPPGLFFASFDSPIGRFWLSGTDAGLRRILRAEQPDGPLGTLDPDALADPLRQLTEYFAGSRRAFDLRLDLAGITQFDGAIYRAAMQVPFGETASYGDLAAAIGSPRAARAVGGAMSRCPLFPVVPCHRVIHADGSITGWGPDLWVKRWLLDHERGKLGSARGQPG
jgi:methylated-DNA-[protein]-cysteine S-methyltransferase